jgi:hypothetical protein
LKPHGPYRSTFQSAEVGLHPTDRCCLHRSESKGHFYLPRDHWSQFAGSWVHLLSLACPVMHLFHRLGGQGGHASAPNKPRNKEIGSEG